MEPIQQFFDAPNLEGPEGTHRLSFLDWGDPDNTRVVICVHGLTRNAHDFDFIARELAKDYRVIAMDMAGRGDSDYLEYTANYNYATYMTDCVALLDNFHFRSVDWIGTSMGGIVGMMIAALHQGRIKRLVLNDIGAFIPSRALERIVQYVSASPASFETREAAEELLRQNAQTFGIKADEHWDHIFTYSIRENGNGTFSFAYDSNILEGMRKETDNFRNLHDVDLSELWEAIDIPTLVLRGAESDILEKETVSAMRSSNIKCQSVEFEGIGHAPSLMEPDQIKTVTNWLSQKASVQKLKLHGT